ncbi:uncharacterized protein BDZ99DRAFT_518522 [Mytilinidion resinicola]|uniref:Uncharacterized protein n=1 Tax=Mytilinidion resinicola TaxID=574789 RepID=A0A6A6YXP8_9PEZI|nr:uncharacterized protein BDZ99DRAFT_518522 [Mytilinidion resinicola]KAF2812707.1 hypothetical protein BDZ99DRAFT_518522 [Mytilinidion resinicola]
MACMCCHNKTAHGTEATVEVGSAHDPAVWAENTKNASIHPLSTSDPTAGTLRRSVRQTIVLSVANTTHHAAASTRSPAQSREFGFTDASFLQLTALPLPPSRFPQIRSVQSGNMNFLNSLLAALYSMSTTYSLALALNEAAPSSSPGDRRRVPKICPLHPVKPQTGVAGVMHVDIAAKYNGPETYGFSEQALVYRLRTKGFTGTPSPGNDWGSDNTPVPVPLSALPSWVRTSDNWEAHKLSSGPKGGHLDPKQFSDCLAARVKELGVEFEMNANVTSV